MWLFETSLVILLAHLQEHFPQGNMSKSRIINNFFHHCLGTYVKTDIFQLISSGAVMHIYQMYYDLREFLL